jgi:hypothetical protein
MATLGQMIRMLGSDQPGDVVAAATAIGKALAKQGKDFHWLADLADRGLPAPQPKGPTVDDILRAQMRQQEEANRRAREAMNARQANMRSEASRRQQEAMNARTSRTVGHQQFARDMLHYYRDRLRRTEIDFLENMTVWDGSPTEKQRDWLNELYEKHRTWSRRR